MENFTGRCAVVTGGASGIGLAMAAAFAGEGMRVVVADRDDGPARGAVDQLRGAGAEVMAAHVDVADPNSVLALRDRVHEEFGQVHLLCNNAGVAARRPLVETTPEEWEWIFGVNVFGVVNGLRAFLPGMIQAAGERHVVNTGSMSSLRVGVMGSQTMYTASKFAVLGLSEALRQELEPHGIGLTVLVPGPVATDLARTSELARPERVPSVGGDEVASPPVGSGAPVAWMDPNDVGPLVVQAVRENRPFAVTHPHLWPQVAAVHEVIAGAFVDPPARP
jgi:NAD(P)-dependent dehydrogenase (short-subunit alcohol dehydrogenase family)